MRRALLVLVALVLAGCASSAPKAIAPGPSRVDVGTRALAAFKAHTSIPDCPRSAGGAVSSGLPSVTLACLGGGRAVDLAGLRGPMIVNFWSSTCGPCRTEMPALASYARSQHRVKVLGIDYLDVQPAAALQLARDSKVGYPLVADPGGDLDGAGGLPRLQGLPFSVYVDATGAIVHLESGSFRSVAQVAAAARTYLGLSG